MIDECLCFRAARMAATGNALPQGKVITDPPGLPIVGCASPMWLGFGEFLYKESDSMPIYVSRQRVIAFSDPQRNELGCVTRLKVTICHAIIFPAWKFLSDRRSVLQSSCQP